MFYYDAPIAIHTLDACVVLCVLGAAIFAVLGLS